MERMNGLSEYVKSKKYREALKLPKEISETYELLAQGEYNVNYQFTHPVTKEKLLLRVNTGSQMHLEHQIEYEYSALQGLVESGRTPKVYFVDNEKKYMPYGVLVMEYLPGRELNYLQDLEIAAEILADIHSTSVPVDTKLIESGNVCREILEECDQMFQKYEESELKDQKKAFKIRELLNICKEKTMAIPDYHGYKCCINTELNSTNFLINGKGKENYLIDWEKPLFGDPGQDLGHFLAPTTTFWKTDVILDEKTIQDFTDLYIQKVNGRFNTSGLKERVSVFIPTTCMRGLTWCAMAWVEYQEPDRVLRNESTWKKLNAYLDDSFISMIEEQIKRM